MVGRNGSSFLTLSKMIKGKIPASFWKVCTSEHDETKHFRVCDARGILAKNYSDLRDGEVEAKSRTDNFYKTGAWCGVLEEAASTSLATLPTSGSQGSRRLKNGWRGQTTWQNSNGFGIFLFPISFKNTAHCFSLLLRGSLRFRFRSHLPFRPVHRVHEHWVALGFALSRQWAEEANAELPGSFSVLWFNLQF